MCGNMPYGEVFRKALLCKLEIIQKATCFINQSAVFEDKSKRDMIKISRRNVLPPPKNIYKEKTLFSLYTI